MLEILHPPLSLYASLAQPSLVPGNADGPGRRKERRCCQAGEDMRYKQPGATSGDVGLTCTASLPAGRPNLRSIANACRRSRGIAITARHRRR